MKNRIQQRNERTELICRLLNEGKKQIDIARMLNMTRSGISFHIKHYIIKDISYKPRNEA